MNTAPANRASSAKAPLSVREPRAFLSVLWLFFLLNIIFRDIHQLFSPGYLEWVLAGEILGRQITDEALLIGGVAVELILLMVVMPHVMAPRALRVTNAVVAFLTAAGTLYAPPIDPDDWFFLAVGLGTLVYIAWFAWVAIPGDPRRSESA